MSHASNRISAEEAAQRLGISVEEVIGLRRRGKLRGYPDYGDWVFEEADVARLAEEMQVVDPGSPDSTTTEPEPPAQPPTDPDPPPSPPAPPDPPATSSPPYRPAPLPSQSDDGPEPGHPEASTSPYVPAPAPTGSSPLPTTESSGPEEPGEPPATPAAVSPPVSAAPPTPELSLDELVESDRPVDSARIIEALAARHRVGFDQAAGVVDGFWNHLLDPRHYRQGRRKLRMPHFGTFQLKRNREGETELLFVSQPLTELRRHRDSSGTQGPSTTWIEHWERYPASPGRLQGLSLKRRLAVAIADDTGLDLRTTFLILWDLVETITGILVGGGAEIRWASRGVMRADSPETPSHFEFRTYKRLRDRLPHLAEPSRKKRRERRERRRSSAGQSSLPKKPGCIAIIIFVALFSCVFGVAISQF